MCRLVGRGRLFPHAPKSTWANLVLASLSASYPSHRGRLSTCYAPVRRFTRLAAFSRDLHVLGTPPAFVLSQDQTLQLYFQLKHSCLVGTQYQPVTPCPAKGQRRTTQRIAVPRNFFRELTLQF